LKVIERNSSASEHAFITECLTLSQLNHKGVIGGSSIMLDGKHFYLMMERADTDLQKLLQRRGQFDERETKEITRSLLETVVYLQSKNVAHRDLKPANIVFCEDDRTAPKLIDFGDAVTITDEENYTDFVGTPPYMAPERLATHTGCQLKKSEVWSIAVIAFEIWTGQRCFGGTSQQEVFEKITGNYWSWPQDRTPSDSMQDFIKNCLCTDTEDRPSADQALTHAWFN